MTYYDANRRWNSDLKEKLDGITEDQMLEYFTSLEKKWTIEEGDLYGGAFKKFNIDSVKYIDLGKLDEEYQKAIYEALSLYLKMKTLESFNESYSERCNKIFEVIFYTERLCRTMYLLERTNDSHHDPLNIEDNDYLHKFSRFNDDKISPYQHLLLFFLEKFSEEGFSKSGENLYRPIMKNGQNTHAWKKACSIKEYIYQQTDHKTNFIMWKNATASGVSNINNAQKFFEENIGPELPALEKDRYLFAFKNGNYISKYNIAPKGEKPIYKDVFVPYGTDHPYITSYSVASKYHDTEFNMYEDIDDWFEIMKYCPTFKSLLDYQEFPDEIQRWICTFMGRTAFNIGELDNWQAILYLLGQAGAGKSTILMKILQKWYDEDDVGIISNNIDTKFGIKPHAGKFMVLAPEISENFKMDQTDWQLLVEGGRGTYAEKYKSDESINWKLHMTMGGNKIPKYKNNSDSISRRMVVANFTKKVINTDTDVDKRLAKELPTIMKLCVSGYYHAVNTYGKKGIWNILPKYFHDQKEDLEQSTNTLQHFLKSGKIVFDSKLYVPFVTFKQAFSAHCAENNFPREQFVKEFYNNIFINNNIHKKEQSTKEYPPNSGVILKRTCFLFGIDIYNENDVEYNIE